MPSLTIRHVTTYRYRQPVAFGEHRMMLRPRDSLDQRVIAANLKISPLPSTLRFVQDSFDNHVAIAQFSGRSEELRFESIVCLEHLPSARADCDLHDTAGDFPYRYSLDEMPDLVRYIARHDRDPENAVAGGSDNFCPLAGLSALSSFSPQSPRASNTPFAIEGARRREFSSLWKRSDWGMAVVAISLCCSSRLRVR